MKTTTATTTATTVKIYRIPNPTGASVATLAPQDGRPEEYTLPEGYTARDGAIYAPDGHAVKISETCSWYSPALIDGDKEIRLKHAPMKVKFTVKDEGERTLLIWTPRGSHAWRVLRGSLERESEIDRMLYVLVQEALPIRDERTGKLCGAVVHTLLDQEVPNEEHMDWEKHGKVYELWEDGGELEDEIDYQRGEYDGKKICKEHRWEAPGLPEAIEALLD
jgi:hypothetical protein